MSGPAVTPEVMRPGKTNPQPIADLDPNAQQVVRYHLAAERCGTLSVWCAAMAGAEILKKKKELGHGNGFFQWKKNLPISERTADNYVQLAKQLEARLAQLPDEERRLLLPAAGRAQAEAENGLSLLALPSPMDVFNPTHERIARVVSKVTGEKTLTQLYFDWGIMKPPAQLGGANLLNKFLKERHPDLVGTAAADLPKDVRKEFLAWKHEQQPLADEQREAEREAANQYWCKWAARFRAAFFAEDQLSWLKADADTRRAMVAVMEEALPLLRKSLRNG